MGKWGLVSKLSTVAFNFESPLSVADTGFQSQAPGVLNKALTSDLIGKTCSLYLLVHKTLLFYHINLIKDARCL